MKKIIYEEQLFEMANIPARDINQKFDLWLDSAGKERKIPHDSSRVKVEFEKGKRVPVSIEEHPRILSNTKIKKSNGVTDILNFISQHRIALTLYINNKWRDPQIIRYLVLVGRRKKSIKEALNIMLEDEDIQEIPSEFEEIMKEGK